MTHTSLAEGKDFAKGNVLRSADGGDCGADVSRRFTTIFVVAPHVTDESLMDWLASEARENDYPNVGPERFFRVKNNPKWGDSIFLYPVFSLDKGDGASNEFSWGGNYAERWEVGDLFNRLVGIPYPIPIYDFQLPKK